MAMQSDGWLTKILRKPAYNLASTPRDLQADELPQGLAFVCGRVPVADADGLLHLQSLGFRTVDVNVQLSREASPIDMPSDADTAQIRFAEAGDEAGVRTIAAESFVHNRFARDPEIGKKIASTIKSEWAGNFFSGKRGEWMVVTGPIGRPRSFLQLLRHPDGTVVIDLIAVESSHRKLGLARAMIAFANRACLNHPTAMVVGTQIANTASLRLYHRLGFEIASAAYILHLHQKETIR
jgi:ribosomal protein S18 acetylase RimI-like enzyme